MVPSGPSFEPNQRIARYPLARRRYQRGSITLSKGKWIGRWREDVVIDGEIHRVCRKKVLGDRNDFATKREAQRALDLLLAPVNALDYKPTHRITFADFGSRWLERVLPTYKVGGSQQTVRRQVQNKLLPAFGILNLQDINTETLQAWVAALQRAGCGSKYIKNLVSTFSALWTVAVAWGYVKHKPVEGVILPRCAKPKTEKYTLDETLAMMRAAKEPLKTYLWITGETGMRPSESCGLDARYIDLENRVIMVCQSVSEGFLVTPKTETGYREFAISEQLAEHLRGFLNGKREGLLFKTKAGLPWQEQKVVERKLNPLLDKLGIAHRNKGLRALRHWNATEMDRSNVPLKTRQSRLGHYSPLTTLGSYTHMVGEDDRAAAARFGVMFESVLRPDVSHPEPQPNGAD